MKRIVLLLLIFSIEICKSQSHDEIIPKSPEASAFIKYGDIDSNLFTGSPNISVPIYTIKGKQVSLPIFLSYDAGGVRVDQIASNVGLNWNLNYGGVVSRRVNGFPDYSSTTDGFNNYQKIYGDTFRDAFDVLENNGYNFNVFSSLGDRGKIIQMLNHHELGAIDLEADVFNFNINGLSGTIGIDYSTLVSGNKYKVFCLEDSTIKVDYTGTGANISSWIITDSNGIKYIFSNKEKTDASFSGSESQAEFQYNYTSSWFISSIITPNNVDVISFNYRTPVKTNSQTVYHNEVRNIRNVSLDYCNNTEYSFISNNSSQQSQIEQANIKSISYNGDIIVEFEESSTARLDLLSYLSTDPKYSINGILIKDNFGEIIKKVDLKHTYFTDGSPTGDLDRRLKLDEVIFKDKNDIEKYKYSFEYFNPDQLPSRDSGARDYWGFYNGASGNLIANNSDSMQMLSTINLGVNVSGANRKANLNYAKNGTLNKIIYPTGGSTEFFYQEHVGSSYVVNISNDSEFNHTFTGGEDDSENAFSNFFYDSNNELCDDISSGEVPVSKSISLSIDQNSANKSIKFTLQEFDTRNPAVPYVNPNSYLHYGEFFLYKGANKSYCEIREMVYNNDPDIISIGGQNYHNLHGNTFWLSLPQGEYTFFMYSTKEYYNYKLSYSLPSVNTFNIKDVIGGLRLYKTISKKSSNDLNPIAKYYYYGDFSKKLNQHNGGLNVNPEDPEGNPLENVSFNINGEVTYISESLLTSNYASSSISQQKLLFNKLVKNTSYTACNSGNAERKEAKILQLHSYNLAPKTKYNITYSTVSEIQYSNDQYNGMKVFFFNNYDQGVFEENAPIYYSSNTLGKLYYSKVFDKKNKLLVSEAYNYGAYTLNDSIPNNGIVLKPLKTNNQKCRIFTSNNSTTGTQYNISYVEPINNGDCISGKKGTHTEYFINRYRLRTGWTRLNSKSTTTYLPSGEQIVHTNYFYSPEHKQIIKTETYNSLGEVLKTKMYYPGDRTQLSNLTTQNSIALSGLVQQNRISMPVQTENYKNDNLILKERTNYKTWNNIILPDTIQSSKGVQTLEDSFIYHNYDIKGNPVEVSKKEGTHIVYIWGYNKTQPIAKIENATYSQVLSAISSLSTDFNSLEKIQNLSDADDDRWVDSNTCTNPNDCNEKKLREALTSLRNSLPNAQVTSFTYDPLIGVTSITDPRGQTIYYHYDSFNRLQFVKDSEGNILSENQYNYKN